MVIFPHHPDTWALADAAGTLAETAVALRGTYVPGGTWGPCGRLDAVLEGVEVVARTLEPPYGMRHRTFVRGYAPHPVLERVALRRRTLRTSLAARLAGAPRTGDALLDRVLVASEKRQGLVDAFLDERLRVALRRLVELAAIEELTYAYGGVKLLVRGVPRSPRALEAVLDVAVAAARWRDSSHPYR